MKLKEYLDKYGIPLPKDDDLPGYRKPENTPTKLVVHKVILPERRSIDSIIESFWSRFVKGK
jgi:hypothetical protein